MEYKNLRGTARTETIINLYNKMDSGELILRPAFQRKLVWNKEHKEKFLETVLEGYPFPEIYLSRGETDIEKMKAVSQVVDGQQRLSTLYQYIKGDENLKLRRIPYFKDLEDKEIFLNSDVVIRDLGHISDDEVKEIFRRINSVGYALNAIEVNNALYDGAFISLAKEILEHEVWKKIHIFNQKDFDRMLDLEYVLSIMATGELGAYFNNKIEIENFIKQYDDEYPNAESMFRNMIDIGKMVGEASLNIGTIWQTKSAMYTLLCELLFLKNANSEIDIENKVLESFLNDFDMKVRNSAEGEEYYTFYMYMYQATGTKSGRTARGKILRKELIKLLVGE